MPRVTLEIRWPDGTAQTAVSPSRAVERYLVAAGRYPADELTRRLRDGFNAASARVREQFGFACTDADEQLAALEAGARACTRGSGSGLCVVHRIGRELPRPRYPAPSRVEGRHDVVVVGGGQAGLSVSRCLTEAGVQHVVLERTRIASTWRTQRWDSFCLVTPNWQCRLPGYPYADSDPDGFMLNDSIVSYLEGFAGSFDPPVLEGVAVERVSVDSGGFVVKTNRGTITAAQVVLAVGGYHVPSFPRLAERLPDWVTQLHSSQYRNPSSLPDGAVLVVGSGQSGAQIAEDLLLAGRDVHLAVGSAPRVARFYRGRDCVSWLQDMGHYDMPVHEHPEGLAARREPNHYVTGRDGGRDIDLRAHATAGMTLHGRLVDVRSASLAFAGDLRANLDAADATAERIKDSIDAWIERSRIDAPVEPRYTPVWEPPGGGGGIVDLADAGIRTIVWGTGFRSDWSWIDAPVFDGTGYPANARGVTALPGLYVLGLPWLHTWGSGRFAGIARDAEYVAGQIVRRGAGRAVAA